MSSIEEKIKQLEVLATELKEAKEVTKTSETEDEPEGSGKGEESSDIVNDNEDDLGKDKEDTDKDGDKAEVKDIPKSKKIEEAVARLAEARKTNGSNVTESKEETKPKMDLTPLFEGSDLSDDFKLKATAIFEAAVDARVAQEVEALYESVAEEANALQEDLEKTASEEVAALEESLVEKVDGYLDYMVEQWMEKNALALNRGVKTEILESFVSGMKELFESHYIDVPDEKYDLVEAAQVETKELESLLDEAVAENIALRAEIKETNRVIQIESAADGLVETDAEKFRELAESIQFTSEEEYGKKLEVLKETYFKKPLVTESKKTDEFMTDTPVEALNESTKPKLSPQMEAYVANLSKNH
jgi:hypothetical protein